MNSFELSLQNDRVKTYRVIFWILVVINLAAFVLIAIYQHERFGRIAVISVTGELLLARFMKPTIRKFNQYFMIFLVAAIWIIGGFWVRPEFFIAGALHLIAAIMYILSARAKTVTVNGAGISYPALVNRQLQWNEVNNVVLKDGLLTIDLRNNRLIQQLAEPASLTFNEGDFNEFCRQHLRQ